VQNTQLGHRGHRHDPLYRARRLLTKAAERIDTDGRTRLRGLLAAGDPDGHVTAAWQAKEALRAFYALPGPEVASAYLHALSADLRDPDRHPSGGPVEGRSEQRRTAFRPVTRRLRGVRRASHRGDSRNADGGYPDSSGPGRRIASRCQLSAVGG
jgi:hypothetical protein